MTGTDSYTFQLYFNLVSKTFKDFGVSSFYTEFIKCTLNEKNNRRLKIKELETLRIWPCMEYGFISKLVHEVQAHG